MNRGKERERKAIIIIGGQMRGHAGEAVQMLKDIGGYAIVGFLEALLRGPFCHVSLLRFRAVLRR